jgi:ATP-dependent exoDNAse (exonuclease V) beta subunit
VLAFADTQEEADWIAERIAKGCEDPACESMAVLVRRNADLTALVPALKRQGVSWQAQEIDALSDSVVVRDLENLLRALYNPLDRVAWLAVMRAPWCGLDNADLLVISRHKGPCGRR